MKYIKYGKHIPDPFEDMSAEDLMQMLQDFLLDSGFYNQYYGVHEMDSEKTMEQLRQALLEALEQKDMISDELLEEMFENPENSRLSEALDKMLQQLADEGYVSIEQPQQGAVAEPRSGQMGQGEGQTKFEITDKALDFLGFRTLKELLGEVSAIAHKERSIACLGSTDL